MNTEIKMRVWDASKRESLLANLEPALVDSVLSRIDVTP